MRFRFCLFALTFMMFFGYVKAQKTGGIPIYTFSEFEPRLHFSNDTTYVVNFWATWCVPCRKELPEFQKIHDAYLHQKVKILLVSLDFVNELNKSLIPYIEKNKVTSEVVVLNDPDSNSWIDKVDSSWSGALPATVIYKGNKRQFFEKEMTFSNIQKSIESLNN